MSSTESSNKAATPNQEHPYPPPMLAYPPHPFNGATYATPPPPGAFPPPFFPYPPPQDGAHGENGQNGVPAPPSYVIPLSGMVYAFPPHQGQVPPGAPVASPPALTKPKRKQVKMACTNCAAACKRCDESRPCERCQKYGIGDTCRDGQRKERKKGIKRGPYKRKNKNGEGEWTSATAQAAAAPLPVAQFPSPEGYYGPIYYPTPGTFLSHPHEVPAGQEGSVPPNGQPPIMPYFLPYPPYPGPYGHPMYSGPIQPPPSQPQQHAQAQAHQPQLVQPQQTVQQPQQAANGNVEVVTAAEGSNAKKKKEDAGPTTGQTTDENAAGTSPSGAGSSSGTTATSKKRTRGSKAGESKTKKSKISRNGKEKEGGGQGDRGAQPSPA